MNATVQHHPVDASMRVGERASAARVETHHHHDHEDTAKMAMWVMLIGLIAGIALGMSIAALMLAIHCR